MRRHSACWQAAHVADAFTALGVPRHDPGLVRASSYPRGTDDHVLLAFRMPQGLPREVGDSKIPEENLILTSNGHARRRFSKILFWVIKFSCHLYNYDNFSWKSDFINIYLNVWNCFFFLSLHDVECKFERNLIDIQFCFFYSQCSQNRLKNNEVRFREVSMNIIRNGSFLRVFSIQAVTCLFITSADIPCKIKFSSSSIISLDFSSTYYSSRKFSAFPFASDI